VGRGDARLRGRCEVGAPAGYRQRMADFRKGDRVSWSSHGSTATGEVLRKITADTHAGGRKVSASKDEPQYLVRSDNGGEAVHKPEALTKR
jgi:hypothetical protein